MERGANTRDPCSLQSLVVSNLRSSTLSVSLGPTNVTLPANLDGKPLSRRRQNMCTPPCSHGLECPGDGCSADSPALQVVHWGLDKYGALDSDQVSGNSSTSTVSIGTCPQTTTPLSPVLVSLSDNGTGVSSAIASPSGAQRRTLTQVTRDLAINGSFDVVCASGSLATHTIVCVNVTGKPTYDVSCTGKAESFRFECPSEHVRPARSQFQSIARGFDRVG